MDTNMTRYEALTLFIAVLALILSGVSFWISLPLQRAQRRELAETQDR
jgi:hypothetical protein